MSINTRVASLSRIGLLADQIYAQLQGTIDGHCARVDFFDRNDTVALCQYLIEEYAASGIAFRILATRDSSDRRDSILLTTDEAVEIRNRKRDRLCLFVPSDLVDAAYSSLANSFALIDGRKLQETAFREITKQLPDEASKVINFVKRRMQQIGYDQRLDFVLAAHELEEAGELSKLGLELWRVGLIADARSDFTEFLKSNLTCASELAHPARISAMTRERIQNLKVDKETAKVLGFFFRGRSLSDVVLWSRSLVREGLTFDRWVFPDLDKSDIHTVTVQPFVNTKNVVERFCKLDQPEGEGGYLRAACGSKKTMVVKWSSIPPNPDNLSSWSVRILPVDGLREGELDIDEENDFVEPRIPRVPEHRRSVTIKLDIEEEEIPSVPVVVKVAPLDAAGNEIINADTGEPIYSVSTEFYMFRDTQPEPDGRVRELRSTVPTLAYGQLGIAMNIKGDTLEEARAQWSGNEKRYFNVSFPGQGTLNIELSGLLRDLEQKVLDDPRTSGRYVLTVDDVQHMEIDACIPSPLQISQQAEWTAFLKTREAFFARLKKASPRDLIETADWTPDMANTALRYANSYKELLDNLPSSGCEASEILQALSVDTLLVRVAGRGNMWEEALIILPTHPFRAAWYANYTQLLRNWEMQLLKYQTKARKQAIDMQALRLLEPINVPAFLYHSDSTEAFVFFQNLSFFHGVALPADVGDPHRRFNELAIILGFNHERAAMGDIRPHQLTEHLMRFQMMHPYVETLVSTLVNPDRGTFFAETLQQLLKEQSPNEESQEEHSISSFQIVAYVQDEHKRALEALDDVRKQVEQQRVKSSDYLLPEIATTVYPLSQLEEYEPPEAHISVVTDFTMPSVAYQPISQQFTNMTSGNALYGLITRFVSQFTEDEEGLRWIHRIIPESVKKIEHPAGTRYNEILTDLHDAYLDACGYAACQKRDIHPMLVVRLEKERSDLLESLHTNTNWVVTLDRFFTLDYYDSPHHASLDKVARKYVLDYSPETIEGLGHRMMVTTAWHEEIETLLSYAMKDLGFSNVEQSVGRLLHYLKTVSGRLALQALESPQSAAAAIGLGTVTALLQRKGRLRQAVLVPIDSYPRLFSMDGSGRPARGERRCDMALVSLKRNIFEATFIEVKWRRGQASVLQELAEDMAYQMEGSAQMMKYRFFNDDMHVDGALQRAYLANVLRFYFERSRRYQLFDPAYESAFLEQLARLEKSGLEFRPTYEGFIVNLEGARHESLFVDTRPEKARIHVLTAQDLDEATEFTPLPVFVAHQDESASMSEENGYMNDEVEDDEVATHMAQTHSGELPERSILAESDKSVSNGASAEQISLAPDEILVPLGTVSGKPVVWSPAISGSPHLFIIGIPGQGKSWTVTRILKDLGEQHVPSLVLDFHGQFSDPASTFMQSVHPLIVDAAQGLPFSPFECTRGSDAGGWKAASYALAEIFANVTNMGEMQRDVIYTAIQDSYKAKGFDDEEIPDIEYPTSDEVLRRIRLEEQARHINNVAARCRPLLEMDLFRPVNQGSDLLASIREGLVIDLHNLFAEELQLAAGAFVLRKLYRDMFRWGYADRLRLVIVLDEAHRLARDVTLPKIMKEGRKFGIAVVVASQNMNDFHQDIFGNAGTKIIFRINFPDSKKISGFIRGHQGQDIRVRIEQLQVGSAYVQTPDMSFGEVVQMYPLDN